MNAGLIQVHELKNCAAFSHMPTKHLKHLAGAMIRRAYAPGQLIFLEGDAGVGLWFILAGRVRIIKQSLNGRVQGLCLVNRNKCFGSCPLFDEDASPASAQALDEVTLAIIPRDTLHQLMVDDSGLTTALLKVYSQRLSHLARLSESLGRWSTDMRINDCLLAYAETASPHPVVRLTHEKLAVLAGTGREVVTRHLTKLEHKAVIQVEAGQIILLDVDAISVPCLAE